ncbi:hypothetical protein BIV57_02115 [Mangrovactinospora gilvigrisea]|uniref:YqaJ viral recombinase domain-containing protein n=1 Tax=Mangrovactinospora gilvigrisea TaxID=1428644 RepID=A0A1J7BKD3_9ACTN|nr:YqaJ viral recombinase family protein [Mangrovactinospora gilvigrisea]OIV39147.1 hypothetical protein BIV57_02115 [Mangrovactinospora gilvigrisea]
MTIPRTPEGVHLGAFKVGSAAWVRARSGRCVTATEIPVLLGISPWRTAQALREAKRSDSAHSARTALAADNPAMEWGRRLEPVIAGKFAEAHPKLRLVPSGIWQNRHRPWQRATPDRVVARAGNPGSAVALLEVKTTQDDHGWGPSGSDSIPTYYRAQVLWQLDTLGLRVGHVACLIHGSDYREYQVRWTSAEVLRLRAAAARFLVDLEGLEVAPTASGSRL